MKFIQPLLDAGTARRRIEHQRFKHLRRWLGLPFRWLAWTYLNEGRKSEPARFLRPLPYLEIAWFPYYLVTMEAVVKSSPQDVTTMVGALDGRVTLIRVTDLKFAAQVDAEPFPPKLSEAEAVERARNFLLSALLRSPQWAAKTTLGQVRRVDLVHYPFWVYYFERRPGRLDVRILDAVTGQRVGAGVKGVFLEAVVTSTRSETCPKSPQRHA